MKSLLLTLAVMTVAAQDPVQVNVRHNRDNWSATATSGWCAVKVWVDDEVELTLQGERLTIRTISGRTGRDIATECSSPLPPSVEVFRFKGIDGRGEVTLTEDPSRTRSNRAVVRIRDPRAGGEEFHYRLEWERGSFNSGGGGGFEPAPSNPGGGGSNLSSDTRDVSRWRTKDLRTEIERLYNNINKRFPSIDEIDTYIDRVRFDRWTFADISRDMDRRR